MSAPVRYLIICCNRMLTDFQELYASYVSSCQVFKKLYSFGICISKAIKLGAVPDQGMEKKRAKAVGLRFRGLRQSFIARSQIGYAGAGELKFMLSIWGHLPFAGCTVRSYQCRMWPDWSCDCCKRTGKRFRYGKQVACEGSNIALKCAGSSSKAMDTGQE